MTTATYLSILPLFPAVALCFSNGILHPVEVASTFDRGVECTEKLRRWPTSVPFPCSFPLSGHWDACYIGRNSLSSHSQLLFSAWAYGFSLESSQHAVTHVLALFDASR